LISSLQNKPKKCAYQHAGATCDTPTHNKFSINTENNNNTARTVVSDMMSNTT